MLATISEEMSVRRLVTPSAQTVGLTAESRLRPAPWSSAVRRGLEKMTAQSIEYMPTGC
jgi:hypothetical protein